MTTTSVGSCPACGAELVGGGDFSAWCPACDWNVDPQPPAEGGRLGRWWQRRQNELALSLAQGMHGGRLRRSGYGLRILVWLVAGLVHLVTLTLLGATVWILTASGPLPIRLVLALVVFGLFLFVQPVTWRSSLPSGFVFDRAMAPALFEVIDNVAAAVGATPVKRVLVTGRFNAAYLKDRRRRPTLEIGIPLWVVLTPQERVAVLGHELGHRVNGDLRDMAFVAYALNSMDNWVHLFRPAKSPIYVMTRTNSYRGLVNLAEMVLPILLLPITLLLGLIGGALELLALRQGQRCEYYADAMGARAAGTAAAAGLENKMLISSACMEELRRVMRFRASQNPWQALSAFTESLPPEELERLRRAARKRLHRIDTTHPPTALRADYVNALPFSEPIVTIGTDRMRVINQELSKAAERVAERLRSAFA